MGSLFRDEHSEGSAEDFQWVPPDSQILPAGSSGQFLLAILGQGPPALPTSLNHVDDLPVKHKFQVVAYTSRAQLRLLTNLRNPRSTLLHHLQDPSSRNESPVHIPHSRQECSWMVCWAQASLI